MICLLNDDIWFPWPVFDIPYPDLARNEINLDPARRLDERHPCQFTFRRNGAEEETDKPRFSFAIRKRYPRQ
jgi:hypothetical protein